LRRSFFELLEDTKFDVVQEYEKLWYLFSDDYTISLYGYARSLRTYIDATYFKKLPFRGMYTSIDEVVSKLNFEYAEINLESLFVFCEFLLAILPQNEIVKNLQLEEQANVVLGNINHILNKTNHELSLDSNGNQIIVEKNKAATTAAEIVEDTSVSLDIIEYNRFSLKGNISEKKKILSSIGIYIEPILKSKILQNSGYKKLESDAGFIFNNFHIRHNNKSGPKAQDYIVTLDDEKLEEWYDKAYDTALAVILINDRLSVEAEIDNLKKNYKWKT